MNVPIVALLRVLEIDQKYKKKDCLRLTAGFFPIVETKFRTPGIKRSDSLITHSRKQDMLAIYLCSSLDARLPPHSHLLSWLELTCSSH